jgi:alpha-tubulin suppressor-like RCC1 family protein
MACDVAGQEGTCSPVPSGAPHGSRTCGGCTGSSFVGAGTCGEGTCASTPPAQACPGGYLCGNNVCRVDCVTDADCTANYFCGYGTCHLKAVKISAGLTHTCALLIDGSLRCWGNSGEGQIGNGRTDNVIAPVAPTGLGQVADVACGGYHTCVVIDDGSVWCWGENDSGQLGNSSLAMINGLPGSATPVKVAGFPPAGTTAKAVAAGAEHTCVALSNGSVYCWGSDLGEQLGSTPTTSFNGQMPVSTVPLRVNGLSGQAAALAAGGDASYALLSDGTVADWGDGFQGSLGNGSSNASPSAGVIPSLSGVTALSASESDFACVIAGGIAKCWGLDLYGELGDDRFGSGVISMSPTNVQNPMGTTTAAVAIAAGDTHACAAYGNATVWCWGHDQSQQLGSPITTTVGTDPGSPVPVRVTGLTGQATGLAAGRQHTCALLSNGAVWCWGDNTFGALGNNSTTSSAVPVQVAEW